jgi:hypothetical protein
VVLSPRDATGDATNGAFGDTPTKMPWSLKVLVAALALYLGWRLVEGIGWVAQRFGG